MGGVCARCGSDCAEAKGRLITRQHFRWGFAAAEPHRGAPGSEHAARRISALDLLLVGAYILVAVGLGALSLQKPLETPLAVMIALLPAGIVTLLVRRRWPVVTFLAALVLTLVSFAFGSAAEATVLVIALIELGVMRSARAAWTGFAAAMGFGIAGAGILAHRARFGPAFWSSIMPSPERDFWQGWANFFAIITVCALLATLIGVNFGHRRRLVAGLVERANQMKRERDQQASIASAQERERIAREMHDVIAHSLAVMIALADGAKVIAVKRPEESRNAIGRVAETGRRTLDDVRRLLGTVREGDSSSLLADPSPQPSIAQLPALVDEFRSAGLPVKLAVAGFAPLDASTELTVYRIVQESLTNVLRHARDVEKVDVRIVQSASAMEVTVEDIAAPTAASLTPGRGLVGMRERAAIYDGVVHSGPRAGGGWRVFVRLVIGEN